MNASAVVAPLSVSDEIYIGGVRYLPARTIARSHGYVRDYVARLCRQGKVPGRQLARIWYVDAEAFDAFVHRSNPVAQEAPHPMV